MCCVGGLGQPELACARARLQFRCCPCSPSKIWIRRKRRKYGTGMLMTGVFMGGIFILCIDKLLCCICCLSLGCWCITETDKGRYRDIIWALVKLFWDRKEKLGGTGETEGNRWEKTWNNEQQMQQTQISNGLVSQTLHDEGPVCLTCLTSTVSSGSSYDDSSFLQLHSQWCFYIGVSLLRDSMRSFCNRRTEETI